MPCLVALAALLFPRFVVVVLYLFTGFFEGVYRGWILPLLGFFFLPVTLLAWTWFVKTQEPTGPFFYAVMAVALLLDLGGLSGGRKRR